MVARHILYLCLVLIGLLQGSIWAVRVYNVTDAPVYVALFYKKNNQAIRYPGGAGKVHVANPGGQVFLSGTGYKYLPFVDFKWANELCASWDILFRGICRGYYRRRIFFSFEEQDILSGQVDVENPQGVGSTMYLGKKIGSALYKGRNMEGEKEYFIFYNPFGFEPLYAVDRKMTSDIQAGKLNAIEANDEVEYALRRYLIFAQYLFFDK